MKIFLTGASGGIGSEIKKILSSNQIEVIAPNSTTLDLKEKIVHVPEYQFDGFIHCAGINVLSRHNTLDADELNNIFNINTFSFITLCRKLKLNTNSNVIAIGSLYSILTKENRIQYAMSKHALLAAVKTIALEKASEKIKVNMISPGFIDNKLTRKNNTEERIRFLENNIPLGLIQPNDIANFCLYLLQFNNAITGQNIIIDGGYSLKNV